MGPDLVDVLVADHREIDRLLAGLAEDDSLVAGLPPRLAARDDSLLEVTVAELVRHAVVEEDYLYPAVRERVPELGGEADRALAGSERAEVLLKRLESTAPGEVERDRLLADLRAEVSEHVAATERGLFPALRQACEPEQLEQLAGEVELAKRTAPTRPHPGAPHTPPWNQILTPGIGLVDKVRDALTGRATRPDRW